MYVKPGENPEQPGTLLRVLVPPHFHRMPDEGQAVPDDMFWRWMVRHKDVVECDPPAAGAEAQKLQVGPAIDGPRAEIQPNADGTAVFTGKDPADAAQPIEVALAPGEPLRLTAQEWERVGDAKLGPPDGEATAGFAMAIAEHDRDPAAPLLTHDEYLAKTTAQPEAGA